MKRVGIIVMMAVCLVGCGHPKDLKDLTFSGTLEMTEHVLGAKSAGRVTTLTVREGDWVKAGDVIATLDRLEQAKKDYERSKSLFESGGTTQQAVEYAQLNMQDQQITVPSDGVVLVKATEIGEMVSAGSGVVVIGDPKDQWVRIFVTEDLLHQLSIHQKATIVFDGTKKTYQGHVSFIAVKAEFTPRNVQTPEERVTQTFAVKVAIDDADEQLHPGVAADVKFGK